MSMIAPLKEAADLIREEGGEALNLCYQCGLCTGTCPWNLLVSFLPHKLMHQAQLGLTDFEGEELWLCSTCRACVQRCPRGVEVIDIMRAVRRAVVEFGVGGMPDSLRLTAKNIGSTGNCLGDPAEERADWAKDLNVKTFAKGTELLYFPCCVPCYDPAAISIARATASILTKLGVDFGTLGIKEICCGEAVRKAGEEKIFQSLAQRNIATFTENGVKKVLVSSPHCYHTFKNEYPGLGGNFEVVHFSQYLLDLIKQGRLSFAKQVNKKVTYHDPCYLGRHNDIYDEPRAVLKSIPGLELVELPYYRENSLCCGGGGGRIWMETKDERFSDMRLEQALSVGANVLAVACPYCLLNFADSVLTLDKSDIIEVKDIPELVQEAL